MTNMSTQPLWLTHFIEILLVLEFQLTKTYFGTFSYKAHFKPQIFSNDFSDVLCVPKISYNLLSAYQITHLFTPHLVVIKDFKNP